MNLLLVYLIDIYLLVIFEQKFIHWLFYMLGLQVNKISVYTEIIAWMCAHTHT